MLDSNAHFCVVAVRRSRQDTYDCGACTVTYVHATHTIGISGHRPTLTNIVRGLGIKKATGHRPTLTNIVRGLGIQTGEHKSRHRATGQKPIPGMGPGYAMNAANDHGSKTN
jgi:hypothetical protein